MSLDIKELGTNFFKDLMGDYAKNFFTDIVGAAVDTAEDKSANKQAKDKSLEGVSSEAVKREVNILIDQFCDKLHDTTACYSEVELRDLFDEYYEKCLQGNQKFTEVNKEELFKRYKIFVKDYTSQLSSNISLWEKRILEKEDEIIRLQKDSAAKALNADEFKRIAKEQSKLLNKLCDNMEVPFIEICNRSAEISDFDTKYVFLGNVFDFDESEERENTYVISFLVKNIGKTPVNALSITNFELLFCKEVYDGNPESAYLVLKAMEHKNSRECAINVLPNSEQKLHLIVKRTGYELNEDEDNTTEEWIKGSDFYGEPEFAYDRLQVEFDMKLVGKAETCTYHYYILLSRTNDRGYDDIDGLYSVDYVGVELME